MSAATLPVRRFRHSRLLGPTAGELTLSVLTGEHKGRQIALRSLKCTIGSARGCTLRLEARGVQPLHCWILRGPGGTIVRRLSSDTRLNGRAFRDGPLAPGDRLRVGSIELEVQSCPVVAAEWATAATELPPVHASYDADRELWDRAARESAESIERLRGELRDLERRATQQLAELNDLVGHVSDERDSLSQQLLSVKDEAASQRDSLLLDKRQLELSLGVNEQQLAELRGHLSVRESEIESAMHEESSRAAGMQLRLEQVLGERAALEARLQAQTESLREQCQTRQIERDRMQEECQRLDVQLAQIRELVGYTAAERDRLTIQLDDEQRRLEGRQQQVHHEKAELQQRLDAALAQLAAAGQRLAVMEVECDNHLHTEMQEASSLRQRLDQLEFDKSELEARLAQQTSTWHGERECLRQQAERVSSHSQQLEGQLTHIRDLVESLAAERDSLCQQLETADMRIVAEQERAQQEQAEWEQRLAGADSEASQRDQRLSDVQALLEAESARAEEWRRRTEAGEQQLSSAGQQLGEAAERLAVLRDESHARLQDESGRVAEVERRSAELQHQLEEGRRIREGLESRVTNLEAEFQARLQAEAARTAQWEQLAGELRVELSAAGLQVTDLENQLTSARDGDDLRLQAEAAWAADAERASAESRQQLASLTDQLAAASQQLVSSENRHKELSQQSQANDEARALLTAESAQTIAPNDAARAAIEAQLVELQEAIAFERESWDSDRERLHQECRMLGHRLIQKQKEMDGLHASVQAATTPPAAGQMTITMDQVQQQMEVCAARDEERNTWTVEREQFQQTIAELKSQPGQRAAEQIATLESQLASLRSELQEAGAWRERQAEADALREQLAVLQQQLAASPADDQHEQPEAAALREQLALAEAEFQTHRREWEDNLKGKEQLLNRQAQELADRLERSAARSGELDLQRAELAERQAELERREHQLASGSSEASVCQPEPEAPVRDAQLADVAAECEAAPGVPEHSAPQFAAPQKASDTPQPVWNKPGETTPRADDDSIEAYMSRLLRRVQGDSSGGAPAIPAAKAPQPVSPVESSQASASKPVVVPVSASVEPAVPEEFLPRSNSVHLTTNLAAMRELANSAARTAIVKHQRKTGGQQALTQSVGAVTTLICSLAAGYGSYRTHSLPAGGGAIVGLIAATYWGSKAMGHALRALMLRAPKSGLSSDAQAGIAPPPEATLEDLSDDEHCPAQPSPETPVGNADSA